MLDAGGRLFCFIEALQRSLQHCVFARLVCYIQCAVTQCTKLSCPKVVSSFSEVVSKLSQIQFKVVSKLSQIQFKVVSKLSQSCLKVDKSAHLTHNFLREWVAPVIRKAKVLCYRKVKVLFNIFLFSARKLVKIMLFTQICDSKPDKVPRKKCTVLPLFT